jgi:hypothetical protein
MFPLLLHVLLTLTLVFALDPPLSIIKKDKKSEHPGTPSMTQVGLESLQAQFNLLEGLMKGKCDSYKTEKGEV